MCVLSGLLCGVSFPPADVGPLILVAMVPLLWVWRGQEPRWAALYGFLFGLGFFGVVLEWSRYFGVVAIAPLVIGEAAFIAGAGAIVATLQQRRLASPWTVAVVWVVIEALRARIPFGGLAWGEIGVALHDLSPARAVASVGGVPLVSLLVVACNALLLDLVVSRRASAGGGRRPLIGVGALVAVTLVASVTWYEPHVTEQIRFALLQGNDQNRELTAQEYSNDYLMRKHLELANRLEGAYDLIVFPESSLERDPEEFGDVREALLDVGRDHGAVILANARHRADDRLLYNANLVYGLDGRLQGLYAKQHLVPFGEYVPFRDQLSFIGELDQVPYDFEPGDRRRLFSVRGRRFATVICFESAFGPLVRDFVHDGAELVVVTTNNRSYRRSGLAAQHVALSQMRAAETARPVLHSSISGISGVIDDRGDVHNTSELFVNRITEGVVPAVTGETLYVRFGDWVVAACALALIALAAVAAVRARRVAVVDSPVRATGSR